MDAPAGVAAAGDDGRSAAGAAAAAVDVPALAIGYQLHYAPAVAGHADAAVDDVVAQKSA